MSKTTDDNENINIKFNEDFIKILAPEKKGVYILFDSKEEIIYYGKADKTDIRERLLSHLSGKEGKCTQGASYFDYKIHSNPDILEHNLLKKYKIKNGKLPKCNDMMPSIKNTTSEDK